MQPSIPRQPIEVKTSKDKQQQWMDEQEGHEIDIFNMFDFDFMLVQTKMVGDKIWDMLTNQPFREDWIQMPPLSQWSLGTSPPTFFDKGSTTTLPPVTKEEWVGYEEELKQRPLDEVSEEG